MYPEVEMMVAGEVSKLEDGRAYVEGSDAGFWPLQRLALGLVSLDELSLLMAVENPASMAL